MLRGLPVMRVSHWYTAGVNARAPVKGMPQRSVGRWGDGGRGGRLASAAPAVVLLAAERLLANDHRRGKSPPGLATRKEPHHRRRPCLAPDA